MTTAWAALLSMALSFFLILLDQPVAAIATPAIQDDFGAGYNEAIWISAAYLLFFAVPLLVAGRLGDAFGQRRLYLAGLALVILGAAGAAAAPGIGALIVARAAMGAGAGLAVPQTHAVIGRLFPKESLGAAFGVWGVTAGLANLAGPIVGGSITDALGWRWLYLLTVPVAVVGLALAARWLPRLEPNPQRIDAPSAGLSSAAILLIVVALQQGPSEGWSWWIIAVGAAGVVLGIVFVARQSRISRPLVPPEISRLHSFRVGNIGVMLMCLVVSGIPLPLMMYFQQVQGHSAATAGMTLVPMAAISAALSPIVGRAADRVSPALLAAGGYAVMAAATGVVGTQLITGASLTATLVPLSLLGVGNALVWSPNARTTLGDIPQEHAGAASGVYNTVRQVGAVLGATSVGLIIQARAETDPAAFGESILFACAAMVIAVAVTLPAARRELRRGSPRPSR